MTLVELKQYMMKVRITSLSSLSLYFNTDPLLLRQMLTHWVRKGCVKQCLKTPSCGTTCGKCSPIATEIYEWVKI
jgi:putative ferrous iron transport protein C